MALFDWISPTAKLNPHQQSIRVRLENDPYCRLQSVQEIAVAAALGIRLDVNRAGVDDWLRLPGISIHQARVLVELTSSGVQFCSIEDIAAVLSSPVERLLPWQPVLSFCYYDTESLLTPQPINANIAPVEQLTKVPAIDLFLAREIVNNRIKQGNYRHLADFQKRLSLSPQLISELIHYLRF